jgi:hypothetical protein
MNKSKHGTITSMRLRLDWLKEIVIIYSHNPRWVPIMKI